MLFCDAFNGNTIIPVDKNENAKVERGCLVLMMRK